MSPCNGITDHHSVPDDWSRLALILGPAFREWPGTGSFDQMYSNRTGGTPGYKVE